LSALTLRSDWFFLVLVTFADNSLQSADKDQQEMCAVGEKPHDADTYRNVQRHRAVFPAIARLLFFFVFIRDTNMLVASTRDSLVWYSRQCSTAIVTHISSLLSKPINA